MYENPYLHTTVRLYDPLDVTSLSQLDATRASHADSGEDALHGATLFDSGVADAETPAALLTNRGLDHQKRNLKTPIKISHRVLTDVVF
jgi:hypothetical protein